MAADAGVGGERQLPPREDGAWSDAPVCDRKAPVFDWKVPVLDWKVPVFDCEVHVL